MRELAKKAGIPPRPGHDEDGSPTDAVDIYTFLDAEGLRQFGDDLRQVVDEDPVLGRVLTRLMQELAVADAEAETVLTRTNRTERRVYGHCIELEELRTRSDGRA